MLNLMLIFIARRLFYTLFILVILSLIAFWVMQLQPGDFITKHALQLSQETMAQLRQRYGLDQSGWVQYAKWIGGILTRGDFGMSFETQQPVFDHLFVNGNRFGWTVLLTGLTFLFSWLLALPLGIYLATSAYRGTGRWRWRTLIRAVARTARRFAHVFEQQPDARSCRARWQQRIQDTLALLGQLLGAGLRWLFVLLVNGLGIVGLSLPNFLTALLILWLLVAVFQVGANFGLGISGLFDVKYRTAPWNWDKFVNFLWHLWPVLLVVGLANIAQLIRYTRANLLDVLGEPFIQTARAKGLGERVVVYKHAVRNALNPLISLLGFWIPMMFEGLLIAAFVFQLPVVEFAYWRALATEDQYVVMTGLLFFGLVLTLGNLLSDVLLALANPKIRYE